VRLAWFTPWPPETSGIAGVSAEIVPCLASRGHGVDVFVDAARVPLTVRHGDEAPSSGEVRVQSAHDFVWRAGRSQYDLVVYQVGNSRLHEFIWPYLFRWPGLSVFHDARLHHARGRALLSAKRIDVYRDEFARNHSDVSPDLAELAIRGFDGPYYYMWPMTRAVVDASRAVAVHTRGGAEEFQRTHPHRLVRYLPLASGRERAVSAAARATFRAALGVASDAPVFGVFGGLTAEKRIPQVLAAFRVVHAHDRRARLLLAGRRDANVAAEELVERLGVSEAVLWRDTLDDDAFEVAIASVDVVINLRWPTAVETSGPWLRALAAGRPTVIVDLAHQSQVPALDPRTWRPYDPTNPTRAITVAIDILDEDHSLRLALGRLSEDAGLRASLGSAARAYWEHEHTLTRMADAYESVLAEAVAVPVPPRLPEPVDVARFDAHLTALVAPFGTDFTCELF